MRGAGEANAWEAAVLPQSVCNNTIRCQPSLRGVVLAIRSRPVDLSQAADLSFC